jgi:hypothetical protein
MKYIKYFLILVLLLHCNQNLVSGTIDPDIDDSKYVEYAKDFVYIGKIIGTTTDQEPYSASCVAIDDNIILTAAHVASVSKSAHIHINNKKLHISDMVIHKLFESSTLGYNDIAICKTENSIGLKWYPELYNQKDENSKICCMAGFGKTGTFDTGPIKLDGIMRAGSNKIDEIELGVLVCTPSRSINKTELEFFISPGDSGGGLFIGNKLAGIHSYISATKSGLNQTSAHTRISDHIEWINTNKKFLQTERK